MTDHIQDRRIRKTKKLLKDTLFGLLQEKTIDKITVKELVERADLNRGTFYFHYKDIYDLLEQSETEALREITAILLQFHPAEFEAYDSADTAYPPLVQFFEWFQANLNFCKALVGKNGDILFLEKLSAAMKSKLSITARDLKNKKIYHDYLVTYIAYGILGVLKQWLDTDAQAMPQEMAVLCLRIAVSQMTAFK